jgi:chemotaxis signal transduction protein/CheY-like chemotaxis protein/ABC-type nitrate/sulfonate/bicarbonate transport system substrate-binding protein
MPDHKDLKILLAEDAKTMRLIEIQTLSRIGYKDVTESENGQEAFEKLELVRDIDLIISDWNMPLMSGFELLEKVRANDDFKDIPFIMATGQSDKAQKKKVLEAGGNHLIAKPFSDDELQQVIDNIFSKNLQETDSKKKIAKPRCSDSGKVILRIAHIQITDHLVMGVLKHLIDSGEVMPETFELELSCMPGWNPVAASLENGSMDGACILAPLAMDLYNYGVGLKLILLTHRNGSAFVKSTKGLQQTNLTDFFKGKSFLIPHKMSIHHMLSHMFFKNININPSLDKGEQFDLELEIVPPVDMPSFLNDSSKNAGFMVAEPICTKSVAAGIGTIEFPSSEMWDNHPCCALTVQDGFAEQYPEVLFEFTELVVKAGQYIAQNPKIAAQIAVDFLDPEGKIGLEPALLENILTDPKGIKTDNLYPAANELDKIQQYMVNKMGIGSLINLDKFIDIRFADKACPVLKGSNPDISQKKVHSKKSIFLEGKYLAFTLAKEEYGINILKVREIIGMMPITEVPRTSDFVMGVINLRGKVIPVADLRLRFGMPKIDYTDRTCIIVVEIQEDKDIISIGIVVDAVSQVQYISGEKIQSTPSFGSTQDTDYILGMANLKKSVKILLDIDKVLKIKLPDSTHLG